MQVDFGESVGPRKRATKNGNSWWGETLKIFHDEVMPEYRVAFFPVFFNMVCVVETLLIQQWLPGWEDLSALWFCICAGRFTGGAE